MNLDADLVPSMLVKKLRAALLAAEAELEKAKAQIAETERYATEGWAWLDEALAALGVKDVFGIKDAQALYVEAVEALRAGWPGISGESYERPITEVHALVSAVLARADELTNRSGEQTAGVLHDDLYKGRGECVEAVEVLRETGDAIFAVGPTPLMLKRWREALAKADELTNWGGG